MLKKIQSVLFANRSRALALGLFLSFVIVGVTDSAAVIVVTCGVMGFLFAKLSP